MTKVKALALLLGVVLLFILPATASAQPAPPHQFVGTATLNGAPAPDGTTVTAWVEGKQVASATVSGGKYTMSVDQGNQSFAGKQVSFKVGGNDAAQTAIWAFGGGDVVDLTANTPGPAVVSTAWAGLSQYLVDGKGLTLYLFTQDTQGAGTTPPVATCTSAGCIKASPPLWTGGNPLAKAQPELAGGANQTLLGTITWPDGNVQVTYNGWPLYYYFKDKASGDTTGQYGPWYVVAPQGTLIGGGSNVQPAGAVAGPPGPAGAAGPAGLKGDQGAAGPDGAAGLPGPAGEQGPAGLAGAVGASGPVGDSASNVIGIIAIILAAVAIVGAAVTFVGADRVFKLGRRRVARRGRA